VASDDIWLPLVDEPIGAFVARLQEEDAELAALVASPRRQLAFRTFAYIRLGVLLGSLLVDHDVDPGSSRTWVEQLLSDPAHREAAVEEVRRVAQDVAADPKLAEEDDVGPDEATRERFRRFVSELD
jgi:ABC-type taurine transport system ATPase subunit